MALPQMAPVGLPRKHPLATHIAASTIGVLTELIRSGAGTDVGDVIDKMTLEVGE